MARDDLTKIDGVITAMPGGGTYVVTLENGKTVDSKLCGKMKQFKIRCGVGDQVTIGVSQYDLTKGLILFRKRKGPPRPTN